MLEALDSKVKSKILKFLSANKEREFTITEIANFSKVSKSRAYEILEDLERREILISKRFGRSVVYSLNLSNENTKNILRFIEKTEEKIKIILQEFLEESKKKFEKNLVSIVLFGSYARGTYKETSDIDLLVVAKELPEKWNERKKLFEEISEKIYKKYGKYLEVIPLTPKELSLNLRDSSSLFITFVIGHKVLFDDGTFAREFREFSSSLANKNFVYYEGRDKWEIRKEAIKYLH
ncbi:MAG: nucleotidyltransferase domain-containing protein [Candidatus Aenigmatarchaeota archaeon]